MLKSYLNKIFTTANQGDASLNLNVDIGFDKKYVDFEVTEDMLTHYIYDLFVIVKATIMYLLIAIRNTNDSDKTFPMYATMQNYIYR